MKIIVLISSIFLSGFNIYSQDNEELILKKWKVSELTHLDSENDIDQESTDHFWNMIQGRTLKFNKDGSMDIPGYDSCSWYIEDGYLFRQFSKTGKWSKEEILELDDTTLKLRTEVDFPEDNNAQIIEYEEISE